MSKTILAASPLIKEPMTIPMQVVLIRWEEAGGFKFSTHFRQKVGDDTGLAHGNYFHGEESDAFSRAYADWLTRCQEQFRRFMDGVIDRPKEWKLAQ
jgi:hypothetical protein